jgi:hypothetical protein
MIQETEVVSLFSDNLIWDTILFEIDNDLSHPINDKKIYDDLITFKEFCINQKKS